MTSTAFPEGLTRLPFRAAALAPILVIAAIVFFVGSSNPVTPPG
jgi:hypothetical protein